MTIIIKEISNGFVVGIINEKEEIEEMYAHNVQEMVSIVASFFSEEEKVEVKKPAPMPEPPKPPMTYKQKSNMWAKKENESI